MSGLFIVVACLAIAFAMAVPSVVRASGTSAKPPVTSRVAAAPAADMFLKLDGLISLNYQKVDWTYKMSPAQCRGLIVTARAGTTGSGPIITKANAMPGKAPGTCVYSLKIPAGQDATVGVETFSWGEQKLSNADYLKLDARDKTWPYYKAKAPSREWIWLKQELKGENSFYKFSYKDHKGVTETNLPIYIELAPVK